VKPAGITRSRKKGWNKPPGTISVSRPSYWENPYNWKDHWDTMSRAEAVTELQRIEQEFPTDSEQGKIFPMLDAGRLQTSASKKRRR